MGLVASSGVDNDDLVDKLVEADLVVTHRVEKALRLVDRKRFFPESGRSSAYEDLAFKSESGSPGRIHISAPCIYGNVLENLDLCEGNSFLNIGSGTGYLNTVVGYLIGSSGKNHGIEIYDNIVAYARNLLEKTLRRPETLCYGWAIPEFSIGNGLCLSPEHNGRYDRVYCGAAVPLSYRRSLWELIKVDGILIMPFDDQLQQVRRKAVDCFEVKLISSVSFTDFVLPTNEEMGLGLYAKAPSLNQFPSLQFLCASFIHNHVRELVGREHEIHIRNFVGEKPQRGEEVRGQPVTAYRDDDDVLHINYRPRRPTRNIMAVMNELRRFRGRNISIDEAADVARRRRIPVNRRRMERLQQGARALIRRRQNMPNENNQQNQDARVSDQESSGEQGTGGNLADQLYDVNLSAEAVLDGNAAPSDSTGQEMASEDRSDESSSIERVKKRGRYENEGEISAKRAHCDINSSDNTDKQMKGADLDNVASKNSSISFGVKNDPLENNLKTEVSLLKMNNSVIDGTPEKPGNRNGICGGSPSIAVAHQLTNLDDNSKDRFPPKDNRGSKTVTNPSQSKCQIKKVDLEAPDKALSSSSDVSVSATITSDNSGSNISSLGEGAEKQRSAPDSESEITHVVADAGRRNTGLKTIAMRGRCMIVRNHARGSTSSALFGQQSSASEVIETTPEVERDEAYNIIQEERGHDNENVEVPVEAESSRPLRSFRRNAAERAESSVAIVFSPQPNSIISRGGNGATSHNEKTSSGSASDTEQEDNSVEDNIRENVRLEERNLQQENIQTFASTMENRLSTLPLSSSLIDYVKYLY